MKQKYPSNTEVFIFFFQKKQNFMSLLDYRNDSI